MEPSPNAKSLRSPRRSTRNDQVAISIEAARRSFCGSVLIPRDLVPKTNGNSALQRRETFLFASQTGEANKERGVTRFCMVPRPASSRAGKRKASSTTGRFGSRSPQKATARPRHLRSVSIYPRRTTGDSLSSCKRLCFYASERRKARPVWEVRF